MSQIVYELVIHILKLSNALTWKKNHQFRKQSISCKIIWCSYVKQTAASDQSEFCTCHDSSAVVTCTIFWPDQIIGIKLSEMLQGLNHKFLNYLWNGSLVTVTCHYNRWIPQLVLIVAKGVLLLYLSQHRDRHHYLHDLVIIVTLFIMANVTVSCVLLLWDRIKVNGLTYTFYFFCGILLRKAWL